MLSTSFSNHKDFSSFSLMTSNYLAFSTFGTSNLDDIDAKIVSRIRDICRQHFPALSGAPSDQFKLSILRSRLILFPPALFFYSFLFSSSFFSFLCSPICVSLLQRRLLQLHVHVLPAARAPRERCEGRSGGGRRSAGACDREILR